MSCRLKAALAFALIVAAAVPASAQRRPARPIWQGNNPPAAIVTPDENENLQWSASVVQVDPLNHQGDYTVKLFGAAGGDPAMNGLNTYIAFLDSPEEDWRIFRVGDFLSYRVLSEARGRVRLEVHESIMNQRTTEIGSRVRRLTISWTSAGDDRRPARVSIATVR